MMSKDKFVFNAEYANKFLNSYFASFLNNMESDIHIINLAC
jgi:hypothetical protein